MLVLALIFSSSLFAETIQVVTEDWAPYNYEKDGKVVGFGTEVVEATLKEAGVDYSLKLYPWARAYNMVQEEANILIYTISRTKERESMFEWVGPFAPRTMYLFKLKKNKDLVVKNLDDAKKYITGVVRDDAMHQFLKTNGFSEKSFELVTKDEQNILKLFADRINFITGNELALAYQMKDLKLNYNDLEKSLLLVDEGGYYMAISKKTPKESVEKIKKAFDKLKMNGKIDEIAKKYLK